MLGTADTRWYQDRHINGPKLQRGEAAPKTCLSPATCLTCLLRGQPSCLATRAAWARVSAQRQRGYTASNIHTGVYSGEGGGPQTQSKKKRFAHQTKPVADKSQLVTVQHNRCPDHMFWPHVSTISADLKCCSHGLHRLCCHTGMD